jgi:hypothetical protein
MGDIRVGKPDTKPDVSAHISGVRQGNEPGGIDKDPGLFTSGEAGANYTLFDNATPRGAGRRPESLLRGSGSLLCRKHLPLGPGESLIHRSA